MNTFKKILLLISVFGFLFPCEGDANLDELVNVQDIVVIVQYIMDGENLEDGSQALENSDVNGDGMVNVQDVVVIVNIILSNNNQCELRLDLSLDWEFEDDLSYFDSEELDNIISQMSNLAYLEGIIVVHNGKIVSESYYNGSSINQTFNIWSVTKSYTSTLIGQAIDQGLIQNQNSTLNNFLPDYGQPYLESITLHDLLTMSSGYFDGFGYPAWIYATTQQLEFMPYTSPGFFFYNSSACNLNSHIIYYATGMTPEEFAGINLFPYLGIETPQWLSGFNGINDGSASLQLTLRDMIKLGQLYLQDGYSGDSQILSSEWIEEATSLQISTGFDGINGYGYLWWLPQEGSYLAAGYGGQYIAVLPEINLVVGTHSNINSTANYQNQLLYYIYSNIVPLFDINN